MACFLVPAAEALVTTIAVNKMEDQKEISSEEVSIPFARKLSWLRNMLWGGSALLAFEHVWHGEIVPVFPFLTAADNPADTAAMLREMATVGVAMAVIVTAVWAAMLVVVGIFEKREQTERAVQVKESRS